MDAGQENNTASLPRPVWHDWEVHNPLGAGSYIFRHSFITSILRAAGISEDCDVPSKPVIVHAGYQPNNSPHIGTITVFALAFQLARALKSARCGNLEASVHLDMVDTAPDNEMETTKQMWAKGTSAALGIQEPIPLSTPTMSACLIDFLSSRLYLTKKPTRLT